MFIVYVIILSVSSFHSLVFPSSCNLFKSFLETSYSKLALRLTVGLSSNRRLGSVRLAQGTAGASSGRAWAGRGWARTRNSVPGAFKLDHFQPFKPILS